MGLLGKNYSLLDSGNEKKLERVGEKIISRPSSLSIWKPSLPENRWNEASAFYDPKKEGWKFKGKEFETWDVEFNNLKFRLRLQQNGQIGIFPEHASYLETFSKELFTRANPKVLSLFAFTGFATSYLGSKDAEVCHVDSSKKALTWARENTELNRISAQKLRFIPEDAVEFLRREVRRNNKYDAVIMDPPSFSRGNASKAWQLENIIYEMIECAISLVKEKAGYIVLTCHHHALQALMLENILSDFKDSSLSVLETKDLYIEEESGRHKLPCGSYSLSKVL